MAWVTDVLKIARAVPDLVEVGQAVKRAQDGDQQAMDYLRKDGWKKATDALLHPGSGAAAEKAAQSIREMLLGETEQDPEPAAEPWRGFMKRLLAQESGGHILLGPEGEGKTTLAVKLAWNWHKAKGYRVEWVSFYPHDIPKPNFGVRLNLETLVHRMGALDAYLQAQGVRDEEIYFLDQEEEPRRRKRAYRPVLPPERRVIVIDEVGMAITSNWQDPRRQAALKYLTQSRHCKTIVLYLAQEARQVPEILFGKCTTWTKKPRGKESVSDRDNPTVREIWEEATEGFRTLPQSPYYAQWPDRRSWAHVRCDSLSGAPGWTGMIPFSPYTADMAA